MNEDEYNLRMQVAWCDHLIKTERAHLVHTSNGMYEAAKAVVDIQFPLKE